MEVLSARDIRLIRLAFSVFLGEVTPDNTDIRVALDKILAGSAEDIDACATDVLSKLDTLEQKGLSFNQGFAAGWDSGLSFAREQFEEQLDCHIDRSAMRAERLLEQLEDCEDQVERLGQELSDLYLLRLYKL